MSVIYWLINTAGFGGLVVVVVFASLIILYARLLRWIVDGGYPAGPAGEE